MFISNEDLPGLVQMGIPMERESIQQGIDIVAADDLFLPDATVVDVTDTAGDSRSIPHWGPHSIRSVPGSMWSYAQTSGTM